MIIVLTFVHIAICFFLVMVVLLQSGKAADLAGAFGGMGSQTAFGPRGSTTVLSKATTVAAGLFMVTSLSLAILVTRGAGSGKTVLQQQPVRTQQTAPVRVPAAPGGLPQPSVTVTPEGGGPSQTIPLSIPPAQGQPAAPAKTAGQPAPAPAQQPAPPPAK